MYHILKKDLFINLQFSWDCHTIMDIILFERCLVLLFTIISHCYAIECLNPSSACVCETDEGLVDLHPLDDPSGNRAYFSYVSANDTYQVCNLINSIYNLFLPNDFSNSVLSVFLCAFICQHSRSGQGLTNLTVWIHNTSASQNAQSSFSITVRQK